MARLVRSGGRRDDGDAALGEQLSIERCVACAAIAPAIEIFQLHAKNRRLDRVETRSKADPFVEISARAAMHAQRAQLVCERFVVCGAESAVAERTEIFRWIKTEACDRAEAAGPAPLIF